MSNPEKDLNENGEQSRERFEGEWWALGNPEKDLKNVYKSPLRRGRSGWSACTHIDQIGNLFHLVIASRNKRSYNLDLKLISEIFSHIYFVYLYCFVSQNKNK